MTPDGAVRPAPLVGSGTESGSGDGHVVVAGAGQAGVQIAESLRALGFKGAISIYGAEPYGPYHRPPLSKGWLTGELEAGQLVMRTREALARKNIDLFTSTTVVAFDPQARQVVLADGRTIDYTGLALATGARPRRTTLLGADATGVLVLRSRDDAAQIATGLAALRTQGRSLVVIGGGFIGLEVAAAARRLEVPVTVLEAQPRLLARALAPMLSHWFAETHRHHGVRVELGVQVAEITTQGGAATGVRLTDSSWLTAGLVVIGVGVDPDDHLARAAGLHCERGIVINPTGRTSHQGIVAAGDCTATRQPDGTLRRLESVQNAVEQGKAAAAALLGMDRPFTATPWFWSKQYDVSLQIAGISTDADEWTVQGNPDSGTFSVFHYAAGSLVAVDSINDASTHLQSRRRLDQLAAAV